MPMARKRILLTGASSGIGRACCELLAADGDEVVGLDIQAAPPQAAQHVQCDLSEPDSIDAALRQIDGRFDALLNVAGVPGTVDPALIMRVNILGLKHLTEAVIDRLNPGGAIVSVASIAGFNWQRRLAQLTQFLAQPDFAAGLRWFEQHPLDANGAYVGNTLEWKNVTEERKAVARAKKVAEFQELEVGKVSSVLSAVAEGDLTQVYDVAKSAGV